MCQITNEIHRSVTDVLLTHDFVGVMEENNPGASTTKAIGHDDTAGRLSLVNDPVGAPLDENTLLLSPCFASASRNTI